MNRRRAQQLAAHASWPALLALFFSFLIQSAAADPQRWMAVTFDDLPLNTRKYHDVISQQEISRRLIAKIQAHGIPAVGFVNEQKLYISGEPDSARVELLQLWLEAGFELGNHTFSHPSLHATPLDEFLDEILLGEDVTKELMAHRGDTLRYFRHPCLHTGRDLETKHAVEAFLAQHGYTIAPVSMDNSEWIYAAAYENAIARGDSGRALRVAVDYVPYMERVIAYYEQQSVAFLGYEIKQILLLHANLLNADFFDEIAEIMSRRGYRFISLAEALTDSAYTLPDTFVGAAGISWLHRWAYTAGKRGDFFEGEPTVPDFVIQLAGLKRD